MDAKHTMRNIGIGMAAGAALGMLLAPQKKTLKATAKKAVRAGGGGAERPPRRGGLSRPPPHHPRGPRRDTRRAAL